MNIKMILSTVGKIVLVTAALMLLPLAVSLCYGEKEYLYFVYTILISVAIGLPLVLFCKGKNKNIFAREGFITVAFSWIVLSVLGSLPFYLSGAIPNFVDAVFETVSGFTTTGASILTNVEEIPKGLLFWRSFTHWIGGMGILVFAMAILPTETGRSIHIMRAEMPGPIVGKLVPKIRTTAKILYFIYMAMTALQIIILLISGLSLFEATVYSFGTAGTGGFSLLSSGLATLTPAQQWIIALFMLLFGINFNLYYYMLIGNIKAALKSEELRVYFIIAAASTVLITLNIYPLFENFASATRAAFFQVSSIMTTTGYATVDFNQWPEFSKGILLILMIIGACAGSTAGGLKVSRLILLFKFIKNSCRHVLHPHSVEAMRFEDKRVDEQTTKAVAGYFALYMFCLIAVFTLLCLDKFNIETNASAAVACFNNIGPGFANVGPMASYAGYSQFSKIVLSIAMLMGRLEIYPLLLTFAPSTWVRK